MKNIYVTKLYAKHLENTRAKENYAELGMSILDQAAQENQLSDLDLLVIATGSCEFDVSHINCGAYFAERYGVKGGIFDITDKGVLAPLSAIQIIVRYLEKEEHKNAMLLVLEQTCFPKNKQSSVASLPETTVVVALRFEKKNLLGLPFPRVIAAGISPEGKLHAINESRAIHVKCLSCIQPLLYLDARNGSTINKGVNSMIVTDVKSNEKGYLVWEHYNNEQ